jgi:hypothetical protein
MSDVTRREPVPASVGDSQGATSGSQSSPAIDPMSRAAIGLITVYLLALSIASSYALIKIWPPPASAARTALASGADTSEHARDSSARSDTSATKVSAAPRIGDSTVALFWGRLRLDLGGREELRLLLVALLAGALGAFVSSAMSFASYLGNRRLDRWWTIWYLVRPPVGMVLALIAYFLLRAGLLNPGATVDNVSPYGVAGIAGLMGMFVKEATDKFRDVAAALFQSQENRRRTIPLTTAGASGSEGSSEATRGTPLPAHNYDPGA